MAFKVTHLIVFDFGTSLRRSRGGNQPLEPSRSASCVLANCVYCKDVSHRGWRHRLKRHYWWKRMCVAVVASCKDVTHKYRHIPFRCLVPRQVMGTYVCRLSTSLRRSRLAIVWRSVRNILSDVSPVFPTQDSANIHGIHNWKFWRTAKNARCSSKYRGSICLASGSTGVIWVPYGRTHLFCFHFIRQGFLGIWKVI